MNSIKATNYHIHFSEKGYTELNFFLKKTNYSSIFILVDENTFANCYPLFIKQLDTDKRIEIIEIEAGEAHKNLGTCNGVWQTLTELGADRNSLLITLGGGVVTDLGGFVAATFKRGIDFINLPTTLLSMVDASVGGKTGVDFGVLKNHIGLFVNPKMVVVDPIFLQTVSPREIRSGSAEIIKYGLTYDQNLYQKIITKNVDLIGLIYRSIEIKNDVVIEDPKEKGKRKILNFGHTIGHAIESYFLESNTKKNLTHGEAIAVGMICECYISSKLLGFSKEKTKEIKEQIINIFGKVIIEKDDITPILTFLKHDKKNIGGKVNFVLLETLENYRLNCSVENELIIESISFYQAS